ncbi:glycosyltransferase family 2 protein [Lacinutrix undariae]
MITVLIPVYNYNITALVESLHEQLTALDIVFEIRCLDDASEMTFSTKNKTIERLTHTYYTISKINNGREQTRQLLAESATYSWLLFLDADTLPLRTNFAAAYISFLNTDYDAVFGGITYQKQAPESSKMLRWTYGKACEQKLAEKRNKTPYLSITSPNFIIKKTVFLNYNSFIKGKDYGFDAYFATLLKTDAVKVFHINNEVIHLGIESSKQYLNKTEEAIETYFKLYSNNKISIKDNNLISLFTSLKTLKIHVLLSAFYKISKPKLQQQLLGKSPSLFLFQLYRLLYLCYFSLNYRKLN